MSKYTPGPWQVDDNSDVLGPDREWIATVQRERHVRPREADANARLIAAAPALLEAAKLMLGVLDGTAGMGRRWEGEYADRCRAAIAKAEGKS
jgi:hypothetical protein